MDPKEKIVVLNRIAGQLLEGEITEAGETVIDSQVVAEYNDAHLLLITDKRILRVTLTLHSMLSAAPTP